MQMGALDFAGGAVVHMNSGAAALAVAIVLDKGCIAHTAVMRHGEGHYLSLWECYLMNRHYRKSYGKLADKVR